MNLPRFFAAMSLWLCAGAMSLGQTALVLDGNYWNEESGTAGYAAFAEAAIAPSPGGANGQNLSNERDPVLMFSVGQELNVGSILVGLKSVHTSTFSVTIALFEQSDITAATWSPGTLLHSESFTVPVSETVSGTGTLELILSSGVTLGPRSGTEGYALHLDVTSSSGPIMALLGGLGDYDAYYYGRKDYTPTYKMETGSRPQIGFTERTAVTGISLDLETLEIEPAESAQVTATVSPENATSKGVIWSSEDDQIATVDESGLVTGQNKGSTTITATTKDGGFTAEVEVTVTGEPLTAIQLATDRIVLELGELGVPLYVNFQPENAGNKVLTWSSEDPEIASVGPDGFVKPVGVGSTTVTATSMDGGFTDSVTVEVGSGWTEFNLRPGGKIYYVSSSEGNDDNDGLSPETPLATLTAGLLAIEGGDWLLLKRGDTFNEELSYWQNGLSEEYRTVFGAYGDLSEPRPVIDPPGAYGMQLHAGSLGSPVQRPPTLEHVAFVSLHLYNSKRDPDSPNYNPSLTGSNWAISILRPGQDVLFEDVLTEWFSQWRIQETGGMKDVKIRRCVIRNNYGGRAQGIYQDGIYGLILEESVLDHNGWNDETNTVPTIFKHNLYFNKSSKFVQVRRNIIARSSSHGLQLRSGGVAEQNVFVNNSIAGYVSNNNISEGHSVQVMNDNVALEGDNKVLYDESEPPVAQGTRSWGLGLNYSPDVNPLYGEVLEIRGNIVANGPASSSMAVTVDSGLQGYKNDGNVVFNWGSSADTAPASAYTDPHRTSASYNESLGGAATIDAYLESAGNHRKGDWNPAYSWSGLWSYIREGFDHDVIHWRPVTNVDIVDDSATLRLGQSVYINATVQPAFASNPRVLWSSSDEAIATINSYGGVTPLAEGIVTLTATSIDGGISDSLELTVVPAPESYASVIGASLINAGTGSHDSDWLGRFHESDELTPWIYHRGLEWLYTGQVFEDTAVWLWSAELETWLFTSPDLFPWVWVKKDLESSILWVKTYDSDWMYFGLSGSDGYLYSFRSQGWIPVIPARRG